MRTLPIVVSFLVLGLAWTRVARAEDIAAYDTEGDAEITGSDPRVAALDEAFARAVTLAVNDVVAPEVRTAKKADLDRELTGRARLWVAKFTVTKDTTADDRRQLKVTVRVDRDKVRAKLLELNIPTMTASEASKGRSVAVLLRIGDPSGVRATFGATAEKELPGLGALSSALRASGMAVKRAPTTGPAARMPTSEGELPVSDEEADALAGDAKAELAAIAGVTVGAPVPVRGIASDGVLVTATMRMIERRGRALVGQGTATSAARGTEPSVVQKAIERALVGAASDVLPPPRTSLSQAQGGFHGEDTPVGEPGTVLVRLAPRTPWVMVAAEQKYLAGAKGVQRAELRRMSPGGWVIGVTTTESVERITQIAKKSPSADLSARTKIKGEVIELELSGAP